MATKADQLVAFLLKELGSSNSVKRFSNNLRELGIADLRNESDVEAIGKDQGAYLFTLVTYHQFGITDKLVDIKSKIKETK